MYKTEFINALKPYIDLDKALNSRLLDNDGGSTKYSTGSEFEYKSSPDVNYSTYGLMIAFSNRIDYSNLASSDSGAYGNRYEIGENPRYCKDNYDVSWWSFKDTRCNN